MKKQTLRKRGDGFLNRLLYIILVMLALVIGGMFLLLNNLDGLVRRAIEVAGRNAIGTEVRVSSVSVDLTAGSTISEQAVTG